MHYILLSQQTAGIAMLNKELAQKIRDGHTIDKDGARDDYPVGKEELDDVFELERAGMIYLAVLLHPGMAFWRVTDKGRKWLEEDV